MNKIVTYLMVFVFSGFIAWAGKDVHVITVNSIISPVSSEYIAKSIKQAEEDSAECLIIRLDTPGGLMTSMREIVKLILNAGVPVVIYVAPSGAQSASAGVFITLAAHFAAMAPGTNIGAAHPVMMGGGIGEQPDSTQSETMMEKVTNDASAYIRSIAEQRGRNADWAERAVRESVSITETEAFEIGVIDTVASSISELVEFLDGKSCEINGTKKTLSTGNSEITEKETPLRTRILDVLSHPNIAYLLLLLGFYGLFFELSSPGAVLPGVLGAIFLLLAFFSLQILPINFAGISLILLGLILFILEVKITSFGMLTTGGIVSMIFGSLMLFDTPEAPEGIFRVSLQVIIPVVIVTALFFVFALSLAYRAHKKKIATGAEGIVGEIGIAKTKLNPKGKVSVHGEIWNASADEEIPKGAEIGVTAVKGMTLFVKKSQGDDA